MEEQTQVTERRAQSLRTVDSFCQLLDRLIIARLKEWHYRRDGRSEDAGHAKAQAEELSDAARAYLLECLEGNREPRVHRHLRYHEHACNAEVPESLMDAVSQLAACHAEYWEAQGRVIEFRKAEQLLPVLKQIEAAQRTCDSANQRRSALVQAGDDMLRRMWEARRWRG